MEQINKNLILNIIYQIFIYIVPLISVPYVSRILGVDNIGIYSYTYSIVYYFMLITLLGINNYGSRGIAKCKDNIEQRSKLFFSLYSLQFFLGILAIIIYNILCLTILKQYGKISLLQNLFLLSAVFDINWFYFGMEKFKITISRNAIIKLLSLLLIFIFVKTKDDLWIYTVILGTSTLVSQLYLWLFLHKSVTYIKPKLVDILVHLKKCLILFIPIISYSIYRIMDKTMLGAISGTYYLGLYENAEKIINIPISFITAIGTVILPHMSKLEGKKTASSENIYPLFQVSLLFIIPMSIGLFAISDDFALVFFGREFIQSGNIIKMLSITIIFACISNVLRTGFLIPREKDNIYVKSTIIGAVLNLVINLLLIPKYNVFGACIGTIVAEFSVMMYQILKSVQFIHFMPILRLLCQYISKGIVMVVSVVIIRQIIGFSTLRLVLEILIAAFIWLLLNWNYILCDFFGKKLNTSKLVGRKVK